MPVTIVHDWDFPVGKPLTNLKTAFWLVAETVFGRYVWFQKRLPSYVKNTKFNHALALMELDRMFGVKSVWGLTDGVNQKYNLISILMNNNFKICRHWHNPKSKVGKGVWSLPLQVSKENMVFDRNFCMKGDKTLPQDGSTVVWHVDHPNNLHQYILLLQRLKENKLL